MPAPLAINAAPAVERFVHHVVKHHGAEDVIRIVRGRYVTCPDCHNSYLPAHNALLAVGAPHPEDILIACAEVWQNGESA